MKRYTYTKLILSRLLRRYLKKSLIVVVIVGVNGFQDLSYGYSLLFTPGLNISSEYSDNLDHVDDDPESDIITNVSPGLSMVATSSSNNFSLSYNPSYSDYVENDQNETFRQNITAGFYSDLSRKTRLEFENSYILTEEPNSEDEIEDLRTRDQAYYVNTTRLALMNNINEFDRVNLSLNAVINGNEDPAIEDSRVYGSATDVTIRINEDWGITDSLSYQTTVYDSTHSENDENWYNTIRISRFLSPMFNSYFQYAHTIYRNDDDDYEIYEPGLGFGFADRDGNAVSLSLGFFYRNYEEREDESRLSVNGDIAKTWVFKKGSLNINAVSGYDRTDNLGLDVFYEAAASTDYRFTRNLTTELIGTYRIDTYDNSGNEREDKTLALGCSMSYQPKQWLRCSLGYNYTDVVSDIGTEYSVNQVLLTITMNSPSGFKIK